MFVSEIARLDFKPWVTQSFQVSLWTLIRILSSLGLTVGHAVNETRLIMQRSIQKIFIDKEIQIYRYTVNLKLGNEKEKAYPKGDTHFKG